MITRNVTVNINNNRSTLQQSVVLYKGDSGLLLNLTLENFKFDISSIGRIDASVVNIDNAKLRTITNLKYTDSTIILPIKLNSNEAVSLDSVGTYQVQLHIYDTYLNRISAPTFNIVCKEPIHP